MGRWDLSQAGWRRLERDTGDTLVLSRDPLLRPWGTQADAPAPERTFVLMVDAADRRAALLDAGYAEALPGSISVAELAARAERWLVRRGDVPRCRVVGHLSLDLVHRDARVAGRWLDLFPREFELLWRLAQQPGVACSRRCLISEVWRGRANPETNTLSVHIARLRAKLAHAGLATAIETLDDGGYRLLPQSAMARPDLPRGRLPQPDGAIL